jgi:hypothetical protein
MGNRHLSFNKRGFIGDVLIIIIFMFIIGTTILIGYLVQKAMNDRIQATPSMGTTGQAIMQDSTDKYISLWNNIFGFIFIGVSLAAAISAYFIDTVPILFPLCVLILAIFVIVSATISNSYYAIATSATFADFSMSFKLMHYILTHLGQYVVVEGALIIIALFTKARS